MNCAVCAASAFDHHGFAGWLCLSCAECGAEAYEAALGLSVVGELRPDDKED